MKTFILALVPVALACVGSLAQTAKGPTSDTSFPTEHSIGRIEAVAYFDDAMPTTKKNQDTVLLGASAAF